jgi:anti-sigma factor RsiW
MSKEVSRMRASKAIGAAVLVMIGTLLAPVAVQAPGPPAELALPVPPDLTAWGLTFIEAKRATGANGRPAAQLSYAAANRVPGPVTIFVTDTPGPDTQPVLRRQSGVNLVFWRHAGHGYYIAGHGDDGWLWRLRSDVGKQLKAL